MTLLANLLAIAIVLNIIESAIPIIPVPGAKIGFSNVVTIIILFIYGFKDAFSITVLRIVLVSVLSGRLLSPTFAMSFTGGVLSVLAMGLIKKTNFLGILGISLVGSVFHALGQILAAIFVLSSAVVIVYLPVMLFVSVPAGALTGIVAHKFYSLWKSWENIQI